MFKVLLRLTYTALLVLFAVRQPTAAIAQAISSTARSELVPTGKLRVGLNFGNEVLAKKDPVTGEFQGVAVDLAGELARRIGVPVEWVPYDAAGKMAEAVKTGAWDVAFLAVDPARAIEISFTAPYLEIEGGYLLRDASPFHKISDVDREEVRIAVGQNSAYDLFLSRNLTRAKLVRAPTSQAAIDLFITNKLEVAGGVKSSLVAIAAKTPGLRVIEGHFMVIPQAMGVPKGHTAGLRYLSEFVEDAKASGLVARALRDTGIEGATVAPEAPIE